MKTHLEGGPDEGETAANLERFNEQLKEVSDGLIGGLNTLVRRVTPRKRKYVRLTVLLDGTGAGYVEDRPPEGYEWFVERSYVRAGAGTVEVFIGGNSNGTPGKGFTGVASVAPESAVDNFSANKGTPNNSAPYYVRDSQPFGLQITAGTPSIVALVTLQIREEEVANTI
jgi:hypothetical protein